MKGFDMRHALGISLLLVSVGAFGCGQTATSGGPGANDPNAGKNPLKQTDNSFTLDVPNLATKVKQGQTDTITIGINRGKNFAQDVALKFENIPPGVTLDPASPTLKAEEKEVKLTVAAAATAALGDHDIKVTGQPATGPPATNTFKLSVSENK
jgi:hypothetical protein